MPRATRRSLWRRGEAWDEGWRVAGWQGAGTGATDGGCFVGRRTCSTETITSVSAFCGRLSSSSGVATIATGLPPSLPRAYGQPLTLAAYVSMRGSTSVIESTFGRACRAMNKVVVVAAVVVGGGAVDASVHPEPPVQDGPARRGDERGAMGWAARLQDGLQLRERPAAHLDGVPEVARQLGVVVKLPLVVLVPVGRHARRRRRPQRALPLLRRAPPPLVDRQDAVRRRVEGARVVRGVALQPARQHAVRLLLLLRAVARRGRTLAALASRAGAEAGAEEARVPVAALVGLRAVDVARRRRSGCRVELGYHRACRRGRGRGGGGCGSTASCHWEAQARAAAAAVPEARDGWLGR